MCTFFKGLSSLKMLVLLTSVIALTLVSCTGENTGVLTPSSKTEVTNKQESFSPTEKDENSLQSMYTYTLRMGGQKESANDAGNWAITVKNISDRTQTVRFCVNNPGNWEERTLAPGALWTKAGNGWVYISASATAFVASTIPLY